MSTCFTPNSLSASTTAETMEGVEPSVPASPTPLAPSGLTGVGVTVASSSNRGKSVARGIAYLVATQRDAGDWAELPYNAVGFPCVFYLRYHGYRWYFPLLALARYRNLRRGNTHLVAFGF